MGKLLTRRKFVSYAAAAGMGALLSGCTALPRIRPQGAAFRGEVLGGAAAGASGFAEGLPVWAGLPPLARIAVIGDLHVDLAQASFTQHAALAFQAIASFDPAPDAVVLNGDIVSHGWDEEYDLVEALAAEAGLDFPAGFLCTMGDHEQWGEISLGAEADYAGQRQLFLRRTGAPGLYYDTFVNGVHLIFLAPDEDPSFWANFRLSQGQLAWLDGLLAQDAARGGRSLVFLHEPPADTVAYTYPGEQKHDSLESSEALMAVLAGYPDAVVITSHTHAPADFQRPDPAAPLFVGTSAVAYLRPDARTEWSEEGLAYSRGMLVDVFRDRAEFISWDFVEDREADTGRFAT